MHSAHVSSPRTGAAAAPLILPGHATSSRGAFLASAMSTQSLNASSTRDRLQGHVVRHAASAGGSVTASRPRSYSGEAASQISNTFGSRSPRKTISDASVALAKAQARSARKLNDSLVYLDGPQVYACAECRTHLSSHDEIISKSFHGRHGK
jgi:hypothetical protein